MNIALNNILLAYHYFKNNYFKNWFKKSCVVLSCLLSSAGSYCQPDMALKKLKTVYGVASFYSKRLEGTTTATGEAFHHNQLIAACNSFKLNSWIRITNLRNGKSVIVRINDRMGKAMQAIGRVADVTISAAEKLGFINRGLARVKLEEVPEGTLE